MEKTKIKFCDLKVGTKFSFGGNTHIILYEDDDKFFVVDLTTGYWFDCKKDHELEVTLIGQLEVCKSCGGATLPWEN